MDRLAGAVKRTDTTTPLMWGEWAVVADPNLPSVVLESDWEQSPRPVRNAAGRVEQYQRVYVLHQGPITTIVANPAQEVATGWLAGTLEAGFTGYAYARRVGRVVEVAADINGTIPVGSTSLATIPPALAPSVTYGNPRLGAWLEGSHPAVGYVAPGGVLGVTQQSGASRGRTFIRGTYILD